MDELSLLLACQTGLCSRVLINISCKHKLIRHSRSVFRELKFIGLSWGAASFLWLFINKSNFTRPFTCVICKVSESHLSHLRVIHQSKPFLWVFLPNFCYISFISATCLADLTFLYSITLVIGYAVFSVHLLLPLRHFATYFETPSNCVPSIAVDTKFLFAGLTLIIEKLFWKKESLTSYILLQKLGRLWPYLCPYDLGVF
jgi:hypothetical protein